MLTLLKKYGLSETLKIECTLEFLTRLLSLFSKEIVLSMILDLFNTLGTTTTNKENTIRQFADKYNLAGSTYNVITY